MNFAIWPYLPFLLLVIVCSDEISPIVPGFKDSNEPTLFQENLLIGGGLEVPQGSRELGDINDVKDKKKGKEPKVVAVIRNIGGLTSKKSEKGVKFEESGERGGERGGGERGGGERGGGERR